MESQKPFPQTAHNVYFCALVKVLNAFFIGLVRVYQVAISPWFGSNCRFTPTCSNYTIEAIREWGAFKGIILGVKRFSKCHPWGAHGYDPVPKNEKKKK
jgi:hypothetical protein